MNNSVALITTSKGRLHHLRETLPLMIAQGADEMIVVDYACPNGSGDWVEANFPTVKVVRADNAEIFCISRARNLGAAQATADWLAFVDADIKTASGWISWMHRHLRPGNFYMAGPVAGQRDGQTAGTAICRRADFATIDGYDETFEGWGGEDEDLYNRLLYLGVAIAHYPGELVAAISHGNEQRSGWGGMQDIGQKMLLNKCYSALKMHLMIAQNQCILPADLRRNLFDQTKATLTKWFADGAQQPLTIRYTTPVGKPQLVQGGNLMSSDLTFTITVRNQPLPS